MTEYYQYAIYVEGKLKWFFGTSKNIKVQDLVVKKTKGNCSPPNTLEDKGEAI